MFYIGMDLSLECSGLSIINDNGTTVLTAAIKSNRLGDNIEDRFERYYNILDQIVVILESYMNKISCIAIEQISYGSQGRIVQLAESATLIKDYVLKGKNKDCNIIEVAPKSLKKFILGKVESKGKNSKKLIVEKVNYEYNEKIEDDNIADSLVLAQIAKCYFETKNNICEKEYFKYQKEVVVQLLKKYKFKEDVKNVR